MGNETLGFGLTKQENTMASTHLTVLCDRTGSMESIKTDAEGAVNAFLDEQKLVEGECSIWLIDFDSPQYGNDHDWFRTVYEGAITGAPRYHLVPRGTTALYDAMAWAIRQTGDKLRGMRESERPERVFFVFQTDGYENASKETTKEQLQAMIKHQEDVYSWVFLPLGSTLDAGAAIMDMMSGTKSAGNVMTAAGTGHSHTMAHSHMSGALAGLRNMTHDHYTAAAYTNTAKFNAAGEQVDDEGKVIPQEASHVHNV
jgi:hypothetical protein